MTVYTSTGTGDFNNVATWGGGGYPQTGDRFTVVSPHVVTITDDAAFTRGRVDAGAQLIIDAVGNTQDIDIVFDSTSNSGWDQCEGEIIILADATYRVFTYENGRFTKSPWKVLPPVNPLLFEVDDMVADYAFMFHFKELWPAGDLDLDNSELWFEPQSPPTEYAVSGTWSIVDSVIASHENLPWYLKPTVEITVTGSYLHGILPTIYSTAHYIIFHQAPNSIVPKPPPKILAEDAFLGSDGEYVEETARKSASCEVNGYVEYDASNPWGHPQNHLYFLTQLETLYLDKDEIFAWTWFKGNYKKASLDEFTPSYPPGTSYDKGYRPYRLLIKERPYE